VAAIRFTLSLGEMLPCRFCRDSNFDYSQRLGIARSLTFDALGVRTVTRGRWARYWFDVHELVDSKLGKPSLAGWPLSLRPRPRWSESMWAFLWAVCWNYPELDPPKERSDAYRLFFGMLLPTVLRYTTVGRAYVEALDGPCPLSERALLSRAGMKRWIYALRRETVALCGLGWPRECGPFWSFAEADLFMEAFRARSAACSSAAPPRETASVDSDAPLPAGCV
ncbi:Hypothetical protein UVM_LOCUS478, partial [uncultured virus]